MLRIGPSVRRSLVVLLAVSGLASIVTAQSLADVAKQAEAYRKAVTHPSKVFTNADLRPDRLSVPPSSLPALEKPDQAVQPQEAEPLDANGNVQRSESVRRDFLPRAGFPNQRPGWSVVPPASNVLPLWQVAQPVLGIPIVRPSCGVNTPREQAMATYMSAAGFGSPGAPQQPCVPSVTPPIR